MVTISKWPGIERAEPAFLAEVISRAKAKGWDYDALLGQISHESGFRATAKNPSSTASGLIQMLDSSAKRYAGMSASQLLETSAINQIPGIISYYDVGLPLQGADFLLLGLSRNPALIGAPDSRLLYPSDSRGAALNPIFHDASGAITVGSVRKHWRQWQGQREKIDVPENVSNAGFPVGFAIVLLGAALALRRKSR